MSKQYRLVKIIVLAAIFACYIASLPPSISFGDGADLVLSAKTLGVAHPTGYPLYILLARSWMILPFGPPAFELNILSAIFAAAALWYLSKIMETLLHDKPIGALIGTMTAVLTFGISKTFWSHSIKTEIFTLYLLLVFMLIYSALRLYETRSVKHYYMLGFLGGLAVTLHLSALLFAPAVLIFALPELMRISIRGHLQTALAFIAGCLPLAYIPLRAIAHTSRNWGDPQTVANFFDYITGTQYRGYLAFFPGNFFNDRILWFLSTLRDELGMVLAMVLIFALPVCLLATRRFGFLAAAMVAINLLYALNIYIVSERSLLLPTYAFAAISLGVLAGKSSLLIAKQDGSIKFLGAGIVSVIALGLIVEIAGNSVMLHFRHDNTALVYAQTVLSEAEPDSIIVFDGDNMFPIEYVLAEEKALNIKLLQFRLLDRDWYRDQVRRHQGIMIPDDSDRNAVLDSLVKDKAGTVPVYLAFFKPIKGYDLVDHGLLYRVQRGTRKAIIDPRYPTIETANGYPFTGDYFRWLAVEHGRINDFYSYLAVGQNGKAAYIAEQLVDDYPNTSISYYFRGLAEENVRSYRKAKNDLEHSLSLDPNFGDAYMPYGRVLLTLGDEPGAKASFERALAFQPQNPEPYFMLAQVYERSAQPLKAYELWRGLLRIPGATPYDDEAQARFRP